MANIPADARAVIEDFIHRQIADRFGDTPPTREDEIAFIEDVKARSVIQVPLMDGATQVQVQNDFGSGAEAGDERDKGSAKAARGNPLILIAAGIALVAFVLVFDPFGFRSKASTNNDNANQPVTKTTPGALPDKLDALVSSGDVKVPLLTPRTLEIESSDGVSRTTFVIMPVQVKASDWPCPAGKEPRACWIVGTVVNYLIGIPSDPAILALADRIYVSGGTLRMRFSTEQVLSFSANVLDVERHETEVLSQKRMGITIPILREQGGNRTVIVGELIDTTVVAPKPDPALGTTPVTAASPSASMSGVLSAIISLGQAVTVGSIEITPIGHIVQGSESILTLKVSNLGDLPLVAGAGWKVSALGKGGATMPASIENVSVPPRGFVQISGKTPGEASAWRIQSGSQDITVVLP